MKRIYQVGVLAVAALAYISCNTELDNSEPGGLLRTVEVSFTKDVDTKTAVVEGIENASYVWTEGDEAYLHVYENGKEGTIENISYSDDMKVATLSVSFKTATAEEYSYTAVYGSNLSNYNETAATGGNPLIPAKQKPTQTSFDPAADILVSREITSKDPQETLAFTMGRVVTVNKMTLTGLENGEIVSSVEFALDKKISARYMVNGNNKGSFDSSGSQTLTFSYDNANPVSDGSFPVYFIAAPVDDAGIEKVVVITDKNVYTKSNSLDPNPFEGKTITFAVGTMKRFTMSLEGFGEKIGESIDYTLVESNDYIQDGAEYLIVYGDKAMGSYNDGNTKFYNPTDVTVTDNVIKISGEQVQVITLEEGNVAGQFYIKVSDSQNLCWNSGNSVALDTKTDQSSLWTITIDANKITKITNVKDNTRILLYNTNTPRFACYTSTSNQIKDVNLYVNLKTIVELADPELAYNVEPISVAWDKKNEFTKPVLSNPHALPVTYSSSNLDVATVEENTGEITFVGNGTTTITASSAKAEGYKAGKAFYQITVTGAPAQKGSEEAPYTIAEALEIIKTLEPGAQGRTEEKYVMGVISEVISFNKTYNSLTYNITADGTRSEEYIQVYSGKGINLADFTSIEDLSIGDQVVVKGCLMMYNNIPEIYQNSEIVSIVSKQEAGIAFSEENRSFTVEINTEFEAPDLINPNNLEVTYSSSDIDIAAVSTDGKVSIGSKTGVATITARFEGNEEYKAAEASYKITVIDPNKAIEKGEKWQYVFTSQVFNANVPSATLEGRIWTIGTDNNTYFNYDSSKGQQFGSGNNPMKLLTLSSDFAEDYGVETVIVNASMASSASATLSVSVGGVSLKCNDNTEIALTTLASNYEFKASTLLTGEIKITISQTTSKALYVKSISVNYDENDGGGTTEPENPDQPEASVVYTLDTEKISNGSNSGYAGNCDIKVGDITWNLEGNSQTHPWRIGGNTITKTDRAVYSKTDIPENISIIEIEHGSSSITVNSAKLIVAKNTDFNEPVSTVEFNFTANSTVTASRPDGADWSNCYYKFVYTVTNANSGNKYFEFKKATFKVQ